MFPKTPHTHTLHSKVGEFDSTVRLGRFTLRSEFPAAFVVQTIPSSSAGAPTADSPAPNNGVLWAVQCTLQPFHKQESPTSATATAVSVPPDGSDSVVVAGVFAASSIKFAGVNGTAMSLSSFASDTGAFILRLDSDGNVVWLRGPTAFELLYINSLAASPTGDIYVAGFYQGTVFFDGASAMLPYNEHVQGWLAKFTPSGDLVWCMALLGSGRNVVSDLAYVAPAVGAADSLALIGSFQTDCTVSTWASNDTLTFNTTLNGTASRTVFVAMIDAPAGSVNWMQSIGDADPDAPAVTCDDHHYIKQAPASGNVYVLGCFSGAVNFSTLNSSNPTMLDTKWPYNSIYVAKFLANGTLVWTQALLGDNISDYPFSAEMIAESYVEASAVADESPVPLDEGVIISAFVQGSWRPLARDNCLDVRLVVPTEAPYGSLYATAIDQTGCLAWITVVANGRAQPAGLVPLAHSAAFALFGTFTGSVSFGGGERSLVSDDHSADVFACFFTLVPSAPPPIEDFSRVLWQYSVIGAFGCLFLLAFVCIVAMHWPSNNSDAARGYTQLRTDANNNNNDSAEHSGDEGDEDDDHF